MKDHCINSLNKSICLILFLVSFAVAGQSQDGISNLLDKYNKETVTYLSVDALKRNYSDYLILDTRTKSEYDISHLPNSIWVGEDYLEENMPKIDKSQKVVVYCTVGVRSENFGEQLLERGFEKVFNLYGSIFMWKDSGYPIVDANNRPTDSVHVYSRKWGEYLKTGKKVY